MKRVVFQTILLILLVASAAQAQSTCVVTGTLRNFDLSPNPDASFTILKVIKSGVVIMNGPYSIPNVNGVVTFTVPRVSTVYIYADAPNLNKTTGVALPVPDAATAVLEELIPLSQVPVSGLTLFEETSQLSGLYAALKFVGPNVTIAQSAFGQATVTISPGAPEWNDILNKPSSFTPSAHASSHVAAGSDPLTLSESQITNLVSDLAGKAALVHTHTLSQITDAGTAAAKNFPSSGNAASGEVVLGSDTRLTDARTPVSHTHTESDVTNLVTDLAAKVPTTRTITAGAGLSGGGDLSANRSFALDLATLVASQTLFDGSQASRTITFGLSGSTDPIITIGDNSFDLSTGVLKQGGTAVSLAGHTHSGSDITSGTLPDARFPATLPAVSGLNLTNLNASNLASGTVPLARLSGITNTEIAAGAAIVDTKLATISTAGKVSDSALSANVTLLGSSIDLSSAEATGTLAAGRFPALTGDVTTSAGSLSTTLASIVTASTNTKITYDAKGRVTAGAQAQFSDLGGTAAKAQLPGASVYNDVGNTYSTGAQDFGSATSLKVPTGAGAAPTASGLVAYDATTNAYKLGVNGSTKTVLMTDGSGANLTSLNASSLASGTVPLGRLSGITNTEIAAGAGIVDTKLATISTAGKVSDTALSANVPLKNTANTFAGTQTFNILNASNGVFSNGINITNGGVASTADVNFSTTGRLTFGDSSSNFIDINPAGLNQWHAHPNGLQLDSAMLITIGDGGYVDNTQVRIDPTNHFIRLHEGFGAISIGDFDSANHSTLLTVDTDNQNLTFVNGSIGFGTSTPDASALLDLSSTWLGFLPPRMTETERDAISTPAEGLVVHNSNTHRLNHFDGSVWQEVPRVGEQWLATITLNVNTTALQDVFTVPAGTTLVITKVVIRSASTDLTALAAAFRLVDSETSNVLVNRDVSGYFIDTSKYLLVEPFESTGSFDSPQAINLGYKVQAKVNAAFGSPATLKVDLFGYLY